MTEPVNNENPIAQGSNPLPQNSESTNKDDQTSSSGDNSLLNFYVQEFSDVILQHNQDNGASDSQTLKSEENSILRLNQAFDEESEEDNANEVQSSSTKEPTETSAPEAVKNISLRYRGDPLLSANSDFDSSDSDSSSTVSEENEENEDSDNASLSELTDKKNPKFPRTKGELGVEDLPPIEDLAITVEESKCKPIGSVLNIVETMVIVQSFPNTPPLDIDTVLFLDRGQRPLGKIFDVFGPVQEPLYCVRFNSRDHIKDKNITKEQVVYCAPQTEYTSYIHTAELMKNKGSDASWADNNEPPMSCLDFSDDEEEARSKHSKPVVGSKRENQSDNDLFVKKMNQRNLELTAKRRKEDEAKQKRGSLVRRVMTNTSNAVEMVNMNSQSCFSPFTDNHKLKTRTFSNNEQSRLGNFHHTSSNTHSNKFESLSQSVNYMVSGYNSPSNFTFPPQHFLCSSPRQLPSVPPNAQNYLTMYSRPPMQPMPPFSTFNSPSIPPLPSFAPQPPPSIHRPMPPAMHPPMSQFSNFSPMPPLSLPTSLPPPNFFQCTEVPPVHQQAFIPLNVRPSLSASFHPQFVLPPPPPPPPTTNQHHTQQRDISRDRRVQSSHQTNSFYPSSPYNS